MVRANSRGHKHVSGYALVLIDLISDFSFPEADRIFQQAHGIIDPIRRLKARAKAAGIPAIYVNDFLGDWHADRSSILKKALSSQKSRKFTQSVAPEEGDYFLLKPMHSAFYQSPLESVLQSFDVHTLILAGLTSDNCIACTAYDANTRGYKLCIPSDCSAAKTKRQHQQIVNGLRLALNANTSLSRNQRFSP